MSDWTYRWSWQRFASSIGKERSSAEPETIAAFVKSHAPHVARVGLETGATSTWLWTELSKLGLPVICIDARHAKAALKLQINKSDRNDAAGIARIMQCGWYKEVRVKDLDSHAIKALVLPENHIRT
jgi:transposase